MEILSIYSADNVGAHAAHAAHAAHDPMTHMHLVNAIVNQVRKAWPRKFWRKPTANMTAVQPCPTLSTVDTVIDHV